MIYNVTIRYAATSIIQHNEAHASRVSEHALFVNQRQINPILTLSSYLTLKSYFKFLTGK